ncbi:MAG TPA: YihY/virulence factor BrkB family protein [Acidimicrobiales bacterium]|nr:YihY/virulence factor BrkB family protein [Acidimicrobiales bacterium]
MNPIERAARTVDAYQQRHRAAAVGYGVLKKFGDDNAGVLCSSLTLSAFSAIFPLLLFLVTIAGLVLGHYPGLHKAILNSTFGQFPIIGTQLSKNVHGMKAGSAFGVVVGLVGLLWGSMGVAQSGLFSMAQIWNLPGPERPNFTKRLLRSLGFIATLGIGLLLTTFLAGFGTFGHNHHNPGLAVAGEVLAVAVNVGVYFLGFRVLTPGVVETRSLWPGALAGGIGWTILQAVGGFVVGHYLHNDNAVYGMFGIVLGLLAWVYLGVQLSMYAAELNVVLARRLWPRGMVQPPLTEADQRSMAAQAIENQRRPEQKVRVAFSESPQSQADYLQGTG